jgi:hypothetical protein
MKHKPEPCDAQLKAWIPQSLFDKVEIAAARDGRSLANMTRRILERWAAAEQPARSRTSLETM